MTLGLETALWQQEHSEKTHPHGPRTPRAHAVLKPFLSRRPMKESASTRLYLRATPHDAWRRVVFYEEVPGRPPFFLRHLLPCPVRSEGAKVRLGASVQCTYERGSLVKQITIVEPPRRIEFDVLDQSLGIERTVRALGGSYEIQQNSGGSEIILTTNYLSYLRPRFFWRPIEKLVAGQLHRHVLSGMCATPEPSVQSELSSTNRAAAEGAAAGAMACTDLHSHFPR
ncbi:MAG TPA: hypothetical protein VMU43_07195 [Candidatus Acidoferrum sp.]|nr:hypothetical protein [Candidatus Acidoferrum sp.]